MGNNRDERLEYSGVVKPIIEYINSIPGGKAINIHGGPYTERGTPDIIGCINGRMVCFECKRSDKEDLAPIQKYRLCQWIRAGAVVGGVSEMFHVKLILSIMGIV